MALSTDEENKVREIIEAFTNGKRLSDLPNVSGNNPFNLLCEVLEDGESKKAALATMLPYMEEQCMYGIERDKTVSSRLVTRIGNTALHKSLPVHNRYVHQRNITIAGKRKEREFDPLNICACFKTAIEVPKLDHDLSP